MAKMRSVAHGMSRVAGKRTNTTGYVMNAKIANTRRLFENQDWPAIDVSRRSVEETAASVINLLAEKRGKR